MKKYFEVLKLNMQITLIYKWNLIITALTDIFRVIAESVFWQILFLTNSNGKILGYNFDSILTYYIFMFIIGSVTSMGDISYKVADDIKNGAFSNLLIRPINYITYYFSEVVGKKIIQLVISVLVFIPVLIFNSSSIQVSNNIIQMLLLPFVLIMALIINYFINILISFLVFWLTEVTSFFFVKDLIVDFLSGRAFPLDILPTKILSFLNILPFAYCTFFPITMITKNLSNLQLVKGLFIQFGWIIVLFVLIKIVWMNGIKKYSGTGM